MIVCGRIGSRIMARLAVLVIFRSACPLSWIRRGRLWFCVALFGLLVVPGLAVASTPAPPLHQRGGPTNSDPVLFVLCNWGSQWSYQPNSLAYYNDVWIDSTSGGFHSLADYWRQVSFGQTNINGSAVLDGPNSHNGWYSMNGGSSPTSMVAYGNDGGGGTPTREDKIYGCLDAASSDLTPSVLAHYQSIVTVTPWMRTTVSAAVANGQTSIPLTSVAGWPSPPFVVAVNTQPGVKPQVSENLEVVAVNTATNTLTVSAPTNAALPAGTAASTNTSDDFANVGPQTVYDNNGVFGPSSGTAYSFGIADIGAGDPAHGSYTNGVGDGAHEVGHSFGYFHSRALNSSTTDYYDCWDQMSFNACSSSGPSTEAGPVSSDGGAVGMDAIDLERQGWVPRTDQYHYSSGQHTIKLHALSDPNALKGSSPLLDAHIPATVAIQDGPSDIFNPTVPPTCSGMGGSPPESYHCDSSDYFTVEYRQAVAPNGAETWDYGAGGAGLSPVDAVVLHLHTPSPNPAGGDSYLVDTDLNAKTLKPLPNNGGLSPTPLTDYCCGPSPTHYLDDQFSDKKTKTYVAVNAIDPRTWTATVTIANKPITTRLSYIGATHATYGQHFDLKVALKVRGSGADVPNEGATVSVGSTSCHALTTLDADGSCPVTLTQSAGSHHISAKFGGDTAYAATRLSGVSFKVGKDTTNTHLSVTHRSYGNEAFTIRVDTGHAEKLPAGAMMGVTVASSGCVASVKPHAGGGLGSCALGGLHSSILPVGSYKATSTTFPGDKDLRASGRSTTTLNVTKDTTNTSVAETSFAPPYGQESAESFDVNVTTTNGERLPETDHVTVTVGSTSCVAKVKPDTGGGHGSCALSNDSALPPGIYAVSATYPGDSDLRGSNGSSTLEVIAGPITVTVSGTQTFGSSTPSFSETNNAPSGITVTGNPRCGFVKTFKSFAAIGPTLPVGTYTILGSMGCGGSVLSGTDASDYRIAYVGATNGFVVSPAPS